jgi:hypothetical protein
MNYIVVMVDGKEGDLAYENKIKEKTLSSHAWISYFLSSLWKSKY